MQPDIPNEKEKDTKARVAVQGKCNNTLVRVGVLCLCIYMPAIDRPLS